MKNFAVLAAIVIVCALFSPVTISAQETQNQSPLDKYLTASSFLENMDFWFTFSFHFLQPTAEYAALRVDQNSFFFLSNLLFGYTFIPGLSIDLNFDLYNTGDIMSSTRGLNFDVNINTISLNAEISKIFSIPYVDIIMRAAFDSETLTLFHPKKEYWNFYGVFPAYIKSDFFYASVSIPFLTVEAYTGHIANPWAFTNSTQGAFYMVKAIASFFDFAYLAISWFDLYNYTANKGFNLLGEVALHTYYLNVYGYIVPMTVTVGTVPTNIYNFGGYAEYHLELTKDHVINVALFGEYVDSDTYDTTTGQSLMNSVFDNYLDDRYNNAYLSITNLHTTRYGGYVGYEGSFFDGFLTVSAFVALYSRYEKIDGVYSYIFNADANVTINVWIFYLSFLKFYKPINPDISSDFEAIIGLRIGF